MTNMLASSSWSNFKKSFSIKLNDFTLKSDPITEYAGKMVNLPKKIDPCPIVEAILEIRFSSAFPGDAVFGILYNELKNDYPQFEQTPILQIPAVIRNQDKNLRYTAHYKAQQDNFILQIGPKMFSINQVGDYVGWDLFSDKIFSTLNQVRKSGVIVNIERIGLRYINILEEVNLFENSNLTVYLKDKALARKTKVTTEIPFDKGVYKIIVASDTEAQLGGDNGRKICGSVIDIDVSINTGTFDDLQENIEYAHTVEKEAFFSILKDEYIKTLNPEY